MILKKTKFVDGQFVNYPDIPICDEPVSLADAVTVRRTGEVCRVFAGRMIKINNSEHIGERLLSNLTIIEVDNTIYVFEDEEAEQAFLKIEEKREEPVPVSQAENRYTKASVTALKRRHLQMFRAGADFSSLPAISTRLVRYARLKLSWERAVFLRIIGSEGHCVAAGGVRENFCIPRALVFPVWRAKTAMRFRPEHAEEKGLTPTRSIVEQSVRYAVICPVLEEKKIIAMVYADSTVAVHDASYFLLAFMCQAIAPELTEILDCPELKELSL